MAIETPITIGQICDAIAAVVATSPGIQDVQSYNQITEGMQDNMVAQVYPESAEVSWQSDTDTITFCGGVQAMNMIVRVDLIGDERAHVGQNWGDVIDVASALHDTLAAEGNCTDGRCPHFGLNGIQSFRFTWQRVLFTYATALHVGVRFELEIRVF
jgi:hypothetical protein